VFHPTTLVNFRNRLEENKQSAVAFKTVWHALEQAGLVARQSRQRLDWTQMFGRVARMSRLDCVRESLRLTLEELEAVTLPEARPAFWSTLWERSVESQVDYRAGSETLGRKLAEAGIDAWQLLEWLRGPAQVDPAAGLQAQLLKRVFGEQFDVVPGQPSPLPKEKAVVVAEETREQSAPEEAVVHPAAPCMGRLSEVVAGPEVMGSGQLELSAPAAVADVRIEPKAKKELSSDRVQNPHDPDAT
jgi:hypothetical protein